MKENKGVTLVALVITIIILLILSGVAIATITGQNSVIENANKAIELAKQEEAKDQEIIDKVDEMFKKYIGQDEIDENAPILKLKAVSNEMLDEKTSGNISEYFTYSENGVPITKVEYTTNGVTVDGTKTKALGGTITCTVTDQNGVSVTKSKNIKYANGGNATEISNYAEIYYGRKITNYIATNGDPDVNWQIYYADTEDNKIYLIGDKCVKNTYIPQNKGKYSLKLDNVLVGEVNYTMVTVFISQAYEGSTSITDERIKKLISWIDSYPNSTNDNIKEVAYLLDTELWNEYYKDTIYGDFAIGGPTIELFCKSYKDTHPSRYIECEEINENGYKIKWSDDSEYKEENLVEIPSEVDYNKTFRNNEIYLNKMHSDSYDTDCLIASPSSKEGYVLGLEDTENNSYISYDSDAAHAIIPVVCLQDNVNLVSNEDGTYRLSK